MPGSPGRPQSSIKLHQIRDLLFERIPRNPVVWSTGLVTWGLFPDGLIRGYFPIEHRSTGDFFRFTENDIDLYSLRLMSEGREFVYNIWRREEPLESIVNEVLSELDIRLEDIGWRVDSLEEEFFSRGSEPRGTVICP